MSTHGSSATVREHTPRTINSLTNNTLNTQVSDLLRRRAESVIQDTSIDATSRAIIRYAFEINRAGVVYEKLRFVVTVTRWPVPTTGSRVIVG